MSVLLNVQKGFNSCDEIERERNIARRVKNWANAGKYVNASGLNGNVYCYCNGGNGTVNMFIVGQPSKMEMVALLNRTAVSHNPMNIRYNS